VIHAIRANDERFRTVVLKPGLNVLLADTTTESTAQDTRNGLGKTLLMEILHFCLGSSVPSALQTPLLTGWAFTADMTLNGHRVEVTRALAMPNSVGVAGNFEAWSPTPKWDKETGTFRLSLEEWKKVLGRGMFGLDDSVDLRYRPSFRSLFPYFARVRPGAYETPFKYFSAQREWQKQVSIAFLLDLDWTTASRIQELKDRRDALRTLKRAMEQGALGDASQTLGQLRTSRVRVSSQIAQLESQLSTFEVHPEYRQIAAEANELTRQLHDLVNAHIVRERKIGLYEDQADAEVGPDAEAVVRLFERAGVELSSDVRRTLAEAQTFHQQVIANRHDYLRDEIEALRKQDVEDQALVDSLSRRRAHLLEILETKHALDELNRLQERLAEYRAQLADIDAQISRVTEVEDRQAALEIDSQELARRSRREHAEREPLWRDAIELFAANTEALYGTPGELVIDLTDNGFTFDVNISRSGSHGIDNMKIFAFDLMLAQRWSQKSVSPRMLWHDSVLYDGVDERQIGAALQLAASESEVRGFQYFCSLNSDDLPSAEFLGGLTIEPVLRLTDATPDGGLFGLRF